VFGRQKAAKEQARRDEEWRSLVRAVTNPNAAVSERDESRLQAYLAEQGTASADEAGRDPQMPERERMTGPQVVRLEAEEGGEVENLRRMSG
jgi:hypothetical protein